jgi:hypothetical protein
VIEMNLDSIQKFRTFYSSDLQIQVNEPYGELKVFKDSTPLSKVYIKVYYKTGARNSEGQFYRDGFTDMRGVFEYAKASG